MRPSRRTSSSRVELVRRPIPDVYSAELSEFVFAAGYRPCERGQFGDDPRHDRGPAHEALQALDAARMTELGLGVDRRFLVILVEVRQRAAAQQVDDAPELCARRAKQVGIDARVTLQRISEAVRAIGDEHVIVVEECI